jgi:protein TonB
MDARMRKALGIALVSLIVDPNGNPRDVHIARSVADSLDKKHRDQKYLAAAEMLDQKAVDAVKQYKFTPAMRDGKPVAVVMNVEVNFQTY